MIEQFKSIMAEVGIPAICLPVIILVILLTEETKTMCKRLEAFVEEKAGKQIKIFDHTKILFLIFWSAVAVVCIAYEGSIQWKQIPLYLLMFIGAGSFCYELVIKKLKNLLQGDGE